MDLGAGRSLSGSRVELCESLCPGSQCHLLYEGLSRLWRATQPRGPSAFTGKKNPIHNTMTKCGRTVFSSHSWSVPPPHTSFELDLYVGHEIDPSGDLTACLLPSQILEVPVTARDVERENHTQLTRWKKNHGELHFKSPPRMHGARVVLLAEPPRRQDLLQNPTIVLVAPPPPTPQLKKGKEEKRSVKKRSVKKAPPVVEIPNPYSLPNDPPPPPSDPPAPPPGGNETAEAAPRTETDPSHQRQAPPPDRPPAKESPLQRSTQSLSSTEQDTYL